MHNNLYHTWYEKLGYYWRELTTDPVYRRYELSNSNYTSRMLHADYEKKRETYHSLAKRFSQPVSFLDVLHDNFLRFTVLGFLDRFIVVRQTSLFNSFQSAQGRDTAMTNFNLTRAGSISRGILRGNLLNFIQFTGVHFQALALSNKSNAAFIPALLLLDLITHPLDTIKTRWQADTRGLYSSLADCAGRTAPSQLFNGYIFKLAYTGIMAAYFANLTVNCHTSLISVALLTAAYPFLTLKSIAQVTNTGTLANDFNSVFKAATTESGSVLLRSAYRGFIPFLALNLLAPYTFPQLWATKKREEALEKSDHCWQEVVKISRGQY
jgi:hypothetical protein